MERMKLTEKEKEQILKNWAEAMSKIIERMSIEMWELEEENKKLKEKIELLDNENMCLNAEIKDREEENKNLKEKVETLELWLDNKEKLNEEYRDKIDLLNYQSYWPSELADSLYDANKTIEKLKAELSKYKKQYQHSMWFSDFWWYDEDEHIVKDENTYRDLDL